MPDLGEPRAAICAAIVQRKRLAFAYGGSSRIVEPYCHGFDRGGVEKLRAIEIGGDSRSRPLASGKLWLVAKMGDVRVTDVAFRPDDPHYNPDDSAMSQIHCRI